MKRLLLCLCLAAPVLAQFSAAPDVTLTGTVKTAQNTLALVNGSTMSFVVSEGNKLGDYNIVQARPDSVTFGYGKQTFPIKMRPASERDLLTNLKNPEGADDAAEVHLSGASKMYALRMLAGASGRQLYVYPGLNGKVSVEATQTSMVGVMEAVATSGSMELQEKSGFTVVVPPTIQSANWTVSGAESLKGVVTLDFHDANLAYVLMILSKETGQNCILDGNLNGSVTIYARSRSNKEILPIISNGQLKPPRVTVEGGFLLGGVELADLHEPEQTGPPINFDSDHVNFQPTPVAEALGRIATKMKLKLVLPTGFRARAYFSLKNAPALAAAERMVALSGHHCRVEKDQLIVEKAP